MSKKFLDKMITKEVTVRYRNKYNYTFETEEQALADEQKRDTFRLKTCKYIGGFDSVQGEGVMVIDEDDRNNLFNNLVLGTGVRVFLFKDMIPKMQEMVDLHGDSVGYYNRHMGMGHELKTIVLVEERKD
jgi:hypothetical protein